MFVTSFQNMNICMWLCADVLVCKGTSKFTSDVASELPDTNEKDCASCLPFLRPCTTCMIAMYSLIM